VPIFAINYAEHILFPQTIMLRNDIERDQKMVLAQGTKDAFRHWQREGKKVDGEGKKDKVS
jgi:hypothetical protein